MAVDIGPDAADYEESEEFIVRRLGMALVENWDKVPESLQRKILDRAVHVRDRTQGVVQMQQEMSLFIEKHKKSG